MNNAQPERTKRARNALEGLSVGDALGERFFGPPERVLPRIERREVPARPWGYTDDTEMALSVFAMLRDRGEIEQDGLARAFARRMDYGRGYGQAAYGILCEIQQGRDWRPLSRGAFAGRGSYGNGAAMRVAPLGAFFADDLERCCQQARLQAEITHANEDGIAGAIAVAVAAGLACQPGGIHSSEHFLRTILSHTPTSETRKGIESALELPSHGTPQEAAKALGNGSQISAQDTVPFCLWVVSRHPRSYADAFWATVSALGDRDTTCAIVGGIVAAGTEAADIPAAWLASREALPL